MRKINLLTILLCSIASIIKAQTITTYFNADGDTVLNKSLAESYTIKELNSADENTYVLTEYYKEGTLKSVTNFTSGKITGVHKSYFGNGKLKLEEEYSSPGILGKRIRYWGDGKIKREEYYTKEKMTKGVKYDSKGNVVTFTPYEAIPEFPGGEAAMMAFISNKMIYPKAAISGNKQGRVVVHFVVDEKGNVIRPKIVVGVSKEIDAEALRIISIMPKWKPGIQDEVPVKVSFALPLTFELTD